jgi:hypothetical protein
VQFLGRSQQDRTAGPVKSTFGSSCSTVATGPVGIALPGCRSIARMTIALLRADASQRIQPRQRQQVLHHLGHAQRLACASRSSNPPQFRHVLRVQHVEVAVHARSAVCATRARRWPRSRCRTCSNCSSLLTSRATSRYSSCGVYSSRRKLSRCCGSPCGEGRSSSGSTGRRSSSQAMHARRAFRRQGEKAARRDRVAASANPAGAPPLR